MQKNPPSSFCAGAAIAAALALGSTGALAQDATVDVPTVAPPAPVAAAPAPTRVMTQAPVVQAVPAAPAAEPAPATQARATQAQASQATPGAEQRPPARRAAARAPAAAAVAVPAVTPRVPVPAAPVPPAAIAPAAPIAAPLPEAAPVPPVPVQAAAAQPADDGLTGAEAGLLGLLVIAGLGGAALVAARRRRRPADDEALETVSLAEPMLVAAPVTVPAAAAVGAVAPAALPEPERAAASPERFVMGAGPVPSGAERDELLRRMVAAPPDEANPFVSRKRRVQRARVLLAERENELRNRSTEPFDWRTYRPAGAAAPRSAEARPEVAHNPT